MKYIETEIRQIADPHFQSLITELCLGLKWNRAEFDERTLSFLLIEVMRTKTALTQKHLPTAGILTTNVGKISHGSVVYNACSELALLSGAPIDAFETQKVLSLIKAAIRFYKSRLLKRR